MLTTPLSYRHYHSALWGRPPDIHATGRYFPYWEHKQYVLSGSYFPYWEHSMCYQAAISHIGNLHSMCCKAAISHIGHINSMCYATFTQQSAFWCFAFAYYHPLSMPVLWTDIALLFTHTGAGVCYIFTWRGDIGIRFFPGDSCQHR